MRLSALAAVLLTGITFGLAACRPSAVPAPIQPDTGVEGGATPVLREPGTPEVVQPTPNTPINTASPEAQAIAPGDLGGSSAPEQAAIKLLAATLNIPEGSITVIDVLQVNWPDASLGCARAGEMYAQVITPGYLVRIDANGTAYEVHLDAGGNGVLCDGSSVPLPVEPASDPVAAEFIAQARFDLAQRLGLALEAITLVSSEAVTWTDSGLGCPQAGEAVVEGVQDGYTIILAAGEERHLYHTGRDRMVYCGPNPEG